MTSLGPEIEPTVGAWVGVSGKTIPDVQAPVHSQICQPGPLVKVLLTTHPDLKQALCHGGEEEEDGKSTASLTLLTSDACHLSIIHQLC